jgi:uncharacterized membrane protein YhhN
MNKARTATMFVPYLVVGVVYLIALIVDATAVSGFTKPLLMVLLLAAFLFSLPKVRSEIALLGALGIALSWLGDVSLSSPGDLGFLIGLGFFLLAHVAYIILFWRKLKQRSFPLIAAIYPLWWIGLVVVLAPHLGSLLIPVAVYGLVLGTMGALALRCDIRIAIGGALFVVSDTILGLDRFLPGFALWQVDAIIMTTYLAAQGLIAYGAIRMAWKK